VIDVKIFLSLKTYLIMMTLLFLVIGFIFFLSLFNNDWHDYPHSSYRSGYYPPPPPPVYYPQPPPYPQYGGYGYDNNRSSLPAIIAVISILFLGMWLYSNKAEQELPRPQKASYKTLIEKRESQSRFKEPNAAPCPCQCDCANQI
jgi:hypothetical protein